MQTHSALHAGLRLLCLVFSLFVAATAARAQNLAVTVVPGGSIDIKNGTTNNWCITAPANMGGATIARTSGGVDEDVWPNSSNFRPDTASNYSNRIYPGWYLRVRANSLPVNSVITIPFIVTWPSPGSYTITVTVKSAPSVTAITMLDPNPTAASSVRWAVTFSESISGVTTANFTLPNAGAFPGSAITAVSGSGTSWIVTASTGTTGLGLFGCNWAGHVTESPSVPNTFTGSMYSFEQAPTITADPVSAYIATGSTTTLSVGAVMRGGGGIRYQWYVGSYSNRQPISGATGSSYVVPASSSVGLRQYSCRVISSANANYWRDSGLADINTVVPVQITTQPVGTTIAAGQSATLSVTATGTAPLYYDWFRGAAGDISSPAGSGASFITPALSANTTYWVRVGNNLPVSYSKASSAAAVRVVTSLTGNGPLSATVGTTFATAPSFTARDSANTTVTGITVGFSAPASGASGRWAGSANTTTATNASGIAQTSTFVAGTVAGTYNVTGTYGGVAGTVAMTNLPGAATKLVLTTAPGGSAQAGVPFAPAPVLQLRDSNDNVCTQDSATVVTATRLVGSGTLQGTTSVTAAAGVVTFGNLYHTVPSTITVQFAAGARTAFTDNIVVGAGAPIALVATAGSSQTALPGTAFATTLQAKLTDAYGNPVIGRAVTFVAPGSGASASFASGATVNTDAAGIVNLTATANSISGAYLVSANITPALAGAAVFNLSNYTQLEKWRQLHFGSPDNSGIGADAATPYDDGVVNLLKYALNLDAEGPDSAVMTPSGAKGLPLVGVDGAGHLTLTFVRRLSATTPGITYTVQFSDDMTAWAVNSSATTVATVIDSAFERVTVTDSAVSTALTRRFARLQVTNP